MCLSRSTEWLLPEDWPPCLDSLCETCCICTLIWSIIVPDVWGSFLFEEDEVAIGGWSFGPVIRPMRNCSWVAIWLILSFYCLTKSCLFSTGFLPLACSSAFTGALVSPAMKTGYLPSPVWGEWLLSRLRVVNETLSSMTWSTGESMPPVFLLIKGCIFICYRSFMAFGGVIRFFTFDGVRTLGRESSRASAASSPGHVDHINIKVIFFHYPLLSDSPLIVIFFLSFLLTTIGMEWLMMGSTSSGWWIGSVRISTSFFSFFLRRSLNCASSPALLIGKWCCLLFGCLACTFGGHSVGPTMIEVRHHLPYLLLTFWVRG